MGAVPPAFGPGANREAIRPGQRGWTLPPKGQRHNLPHPLPYFRTSAESPPPQARATRGSQVLTLAPHGSGLIGAGLYALAGLGGASLGGRAWARLGVAGWQGGITRFLQALLR